MLQIRTLTKKFGSLAALDQVSLSLEPNKTHVLLGSSGSGKSTLLRAILGLVACDEGSIQINGTLVSALSAKERARQIGYVPQDAGLFPHLTSEDNMTLVARSLGWDRAKLKDRMQRLNQIVQLDDALFTRYPSELSGGQKQRVALLRSLFLDPPLILMDEPFAALDPLVRADIQTEVKSLFSRLEKTVVFVTHDVGEAHFLSDNIVLMDQGRVIQQGKLQDLVDRPAGPFVTRFLQAQRIYHAPERTS
jgi:osmoprotectant transport system ATP-binding protein